MGDHSAGMTLAAAVCAALLVPLTISDVSGQPLLDHLGPVDVWSASGLVDVSVAWRWTAILAAAVTIASLPVLRWGWTPVLLDLATNSLFIHLVAAALWAGGLLALLAHAIRAGTGTSDDSNTVLAARRFSALALWCFVATGLSGPKTDRPSSRRR